MAFAEALTQFRATVPPAPLLPEVVAVPRRVTPLFIQMPFPIVSEADLERALAQEGV